MTETQLSHAIQQALAKCGFMVERIQSGKVKVKRAWMQLASEGTPDLHVVGVGWLEVKVGKGKLSEAQECWHRRAIARGARVAVVRSVQEAVETVVEWRATPCW